MNLRNTLLGLKAIAPSKLKVVSLYNDDAFVNGCSSVWRNASPTKLLTFAPLCAIRNPAPGLPVSMPPRTFIGGLDALGVSGSLMDPSGMDADCLIRSVFLGHQHIPNVHTMTDAYWRHDHVDAVAIGGVKSWSGFAASLRRTLIEEFEEQQASSAVLGVEVSSCLFHLKRLLAPNSSEADRGHLPYTLALLLGDMMSVPVIVITQNCGPAEVSCGESAYGVHSNKMFRGEFVGAVSLVLKGNHFYVYVPEQNVIAAYHVDLAVVAESGSIVPPTLCFGDRVVGNHAWVEVATAAHVNPAKGGVSSWSADKPGFNANTPPVSPRLMGGCHVILPPLPPRHGFPSPSVDKSRLHARSSTASPMRVDCDGFSLPSVPSWCVSPPSAEPVNGLALAGGSLSALHDLEAIDEIAASDDLKNRMSVERGSERARSAALGHGSPSSHSEGFVSSGSDGSARRKGSPRRRKRRHNGSSGGGSQGQVCDVDLSMSQQQDDDGIQPSMDIGTPLDGAYDDPGSDGMVEGFLDSVDDFVDHESS
eukprot:gene9439-4074_t